MKTEDDLYDIEWGFFVDLDPEISNIPLIRKKVYYPQYLTSINENDIYYDNISKIDDNKKSKNKKHKNSDDLTDTLEMDIPKKSPYSTSNVKTYVAVSASSVVIATLILYYETRIFS